MADNVIDTAQAKIEFLTFLRNMNVISVSDRGVTTATDETHSGDGIETDFDIDEIGVKNIRSLVVDSVTQVYGQHYTISENETTFVTTISFITPPADDTDNIVLTYDYGNGDKIFDDFPRPDLRIKSFPRIGFDIMSVDSVAAGFGGALVSDIDLQIGLHVVGRKLLDQYAKTIRSAIIDNADNFHYLNHLIPLGRGSDIPLPAGENKVFSKNMLVRSILNWEVN